MAGRGVAVGVRRLSGRRRGGDVKGGGALTLDQLEAAHARLLSETCGHLRGVTERDM